ncbi:RRM-domain-containing protein [Astathelohania contejeani]|uniref:RRM-domain-containing protein n=1 Tax=Astathelohania contejeani TaxID=164912 RepID=A0ABQ7I0M8_9MICR|nr:RRM-domain-containing protein [Thelohania contejeani]
METVKFNPNHEEIKNRLKIRPFGSVTDQIATPSTPPPPFKIVSEEDAKPQSSGEAYVFNFMRKVQNTPKESEHYVPPISQRKPTTLRIGNLPLSFTRKDLETYISKTCKVFVLSTNVISDFETKKSKGFGFVTLSSEEDAKKVKEMIDGSVVDCLVLNVVFAKK